MIILHAILPCCVLMNKCHERTSYIASCLITLKGGASIKFDQFCLHWSCSPLSRSLNSRGRATPMQAKWIKRNLNAASEFAVISVWKIIDVGNILISYMEWIRHYQLQAHVRSICIEAVIGLIKCWGILGIRGIQRIWRIEGLGIWYSYHKTVTKMYSFWDMVNLWLIMLRRMYHKFEPVQGAW